jgi:hypothetical protein
LAGNFDGEFWWEILEGNFGSKFWWEILTGKFGGKFWRERFLLDGMHQILIKKNNFFFVCDKKLQC